MPTNIIFRYISRRILILTAIFFPLQLLAQDITGVWKGSIITTDKQLPYELAISEVDGKLTGYSYTKFTVNGKEMMAVKSIKVKNDNGHVTVSDDDFIYDNFVQSQARQIKQTSELTLTTDGSLMKMDGDFKTRNTRDFRKLSGKISLQKFDSTAETSIIPVLDSLKLKSELSFLQPKKPVESFAAVVPKTSTEKITATPIRNNSLDAIAKTPVIQNNNTTRKIITEPDVEKVIPVEIKPVVAVTAPVKKTPVIVPAKEIPKPVATKPVVIAAAPSKPVAVATAPPKPVPAVSKPNVTGPDFTANLAKRSIETIKTLEFKSDSLTLTLYDNGEVDGDTVSVIMNGKILMAKQGLSTNAINKTIYITPDMGDSIQLVMYAENLGSLPPNTGLLIIKDGNDRYEIRFAGDLNKNAGITLRRKKLQ